MHVHIISSELCSVTSVNTQGGLCSPSLSMALRRLAQENHASGSPQTPSGSLMNGPPPTTPRPRPLYPIHRSPANMPSISSSVPFDWEAARSRAPPPYASPLSTRPRKSLGTATSTGTPRKGIVRKKGVFER